MAAEDRLVKTMAEYPDLPLRDVVFRTLRKGILCEDLKPGERLMEIQLANRLGVSRTPVREAIRMLELEGLVVNLPRRGAQVAKITAKDLHDVLEVRKGLDQMAFELAVERITEEELEALFAASREFERLVENADVTSLAEADEAFHAIIYQATGNKRLVQLINNLREQMYRYRVEYLKNRSNLQNLIQEHDQLWQSLKNRDAVGGSEAMGAHIEHQMAGILDSL
ncbi:MAG: GntR family transcriptional regulator [Eubacteriales bacterium]|nr:GntR family transcriptional regulator [Eubacteriales bacterium]